MNGWQPIATAPKSRERFLVGGAGDCGYGFAKWEEGNSIYRIAREDGHVYWRTGITPYTHWMPLPAPPTEEGS